MRARITNERPTEIPTAETATALCHGGQACQNFAKFIGAAYTLCSKSEGSAADSGAAGDGAQVYKGMHLLENDLCLPDPLPTSGATAACRLLLAFVDGGCGQAGLEVDTASSADLAAINAQQPAGQPPLQNPLCNFKQLGASSPGAGCSDERMSGWCYVQGSCSTDSGSRCKQDICTTAAFGAEQVAYGEVWLACP